MKYQFIAEHRQEYPISTMRRVLEVAVSGFYAWLRRVPAAARRTRGWGSVSRASITPIDKSMVAHAFTPCCTPKASRAGRSASRG